jgi:hypothetical protein
MSYMHPVTPRTPGGAMNPHGHDDVADALAQLERWLDARGETRPGAVVSVEFDRTPGLLCITVTLDAGAVATCLLELQHNYHATGELWPWSWRA